MRPVFLHAERPAGSFGGSKQMDITQMEKDLGQKFTVEFPSHRFDIDYFHRGDLLFQKRKDGEGVAATCPYVVGPMVAFALGTGTSGETFQLTGEVSIDFYNEGKGVRCALRSLMGKWPEKALEASRGEGESDGDFQKRLLGVWEAGASQSARPEEAKAQVQLAVKLVSAILKEGGGQVEK